MLKSLYIRSQNEFQVESYIISSDGRAIRWTCFSCQADNVIEFRFPLFPRLVKWRCRVCGNEELVYRPDAWSKEAMRIYVAVHEEGEGAKATTKWSD